MKAKSRNLQRTFDDIIDKVFLGFIPHSVKPNQVTYVRFVLIPIVYWLLVSGEFGWALFVFVIAASTDFIDGAMARKRNQITDVGKIIDPIADKLLIMSVLFYIGFDYLIVKILIISIILELIAVISSVIFAYKFGRPVGANLYGKIKMILQSVSVGMFLLGIMISNNLVIKVSEYMLYSALFFAVLAGLENIKHKVDSQTI
jgi:CDP-diacylglycerol--glycerol-3-phosphate 3-phosphatidyltransferase